MLARMRKKTSSQTQDPQLQLLRLPDPCRYEAHFLMKVVLVMMTTTTISEP
jgi:hypothetical protein